MARSRSDPWEEAEAVQPVFVLGLAAGMEAEAEHGCDSAVGEEHFSGR